MNSKGYKEELIRSSAAHYFTNGSLRDTAKAFGVAVSTLSRWKKTSAVWRSEWKKLEQQTAATRERVYSTHEELITETTGALSEFCLAGLHKAIAAQKALRIDIENVELPEKITSLEELSLAIRALRDLNSLVDQTWQNFITAIDLEEYLNHNQSPPQIEFSEYTEAEIQAIQDESN